MGNGIYGAQAASQYWFKKSANKLSQTQASAIAAILPNPRVYKANPKSNYIKGRTVWITKQMTYFGALDYPEKTNEKRNRN